MWSWVNYLTVWACFPIFIKRMRKVTPEVFIDLECLHKVFSTIHVPVPIQHTAASSLIVATHRTDR